MHAFHEQPSVRRTTRARYWSGGRIPTRPLAAVKRAASAARAGGSRATITRRRSSDSPTALPGTSGGAPCRRTASACAASARAASTTAVPSSGERRRRTRGSRGVASRLCSRLPSRPRRYVPLSRTSAYGRPARSHDETRSSPTARTVDASASRSVAGRPPASERRRIGSAGGTGGIYPSGGDCRGGRGGASSEADRGPALEGKETDGRVTERKQKRRAIALRPRWHAVARARERRSRAGPTAPLSSSAARACSWRGCRPAGRDRPRGSCCPGPGAASGTRAPRATGRAPGAACRGRRGRA